jgi:AcrR family transcriptional regulator
MAMARPERPATPKGRARREQLLEAAMTAFAAQGFRGVAVDTIAAEVGISQAGLLHYFPSKAALLIETLEHFQQLSRARATLNPLGSGSFASHLVVVARQHEIDPRFIRLLLVLAAESTNVDHPAHEWFVRRYKDTRESFERQLAADQGAKLLRADVNVATLAPLAIAMMDGLEVQFLLSGGVSKIAQPLDAFLSTFYR